MSRAEKLAREIFSDSDLQEISTAISNFEARTSGEIVISFNTSSNNQPYKTENEFSKKPNCIKPKRAMLR